MGLTSARLRFESGRMAFHRRNDGQATQSTQALIDNLIFSRIENLRTTYLILQVFSLIAVLLIVLRMLYDAKRKAALAVSLRPRLV